MNDNPLPMRFYIEISCIQINKVKDFHESMNPWITRNWLYVPWHTNTNFRICERSVAFFMDIPRSTNPAKIFRINSCRENDASNRRYVWREWFSLLWVNKVNKESYLRIIFKYMGRSTSVYQAFKIDDPMIFIFTN